MDDSEELKRAFLNERGSNRYLSCEDCTRQAGFEKVTRNSLDLGNIEACCAVRSADASVAPYSKHRHSICVYSK
jgi:hypothetical protein